MVDKVVLDKPAYPLSSGCSPIEADSCLVNATLADMRIRVNDMLGLHHVEITQPVAGDPEVKAASDALLKAAASTFATNQETRDFKAQMDKFEQRAQQQGLAPHVVASTYAQLSKILSFKGEEPLQSDERQAFAEQLMSHLSDPSPNTIKQGWHNTCPWAFLEMRTLTREPDKVAAMAAELVTTGSFHDARGKLIQVDKASLSPDEEANNFPPRSFNRDYASQITEVMFNNIHWSYYGKDPAGQKVAPGSIQYEQLEHVARPAPTAPATDPGDSGERLKEVIGGKTVVNGTDAGGEGGEAYLSDVESTEALVVGHDVRRSIIESSHGIGDDLGMRVNSPGQLASALEKLQGQGQLPIGLAVNVTHSPLKEDYLDRHPNKTSAPDSWHFVAVSKIYKSGDGKEMVTMWNPWGIVREVPIATMYDCLLRPPAKKKCVVPV